MSRPFFGLALPVVQQVPGHAAAWESGAGGAEILQLARAAERFGFDAVGCSDHVLVVASRRGAMGATWYEPAATLGFIAGATERIGLLTHVLVLPYRHPLAAAKTYATLDRLSRGRVILGVGSGHAKPEFRILGAPFEKRGRFTDEAIAAMRAAWSGEVATFEGELVGFRDVVLSPRPFRDGGPPIWVGGNGSRALARAARLGDGWIPWRLSPDDFRDAVAAGRRMREEAGRSGAFHWIAPLHVDADATAGVVEAAIAAWSEAGATGFHVGVRSPTAGAALERLEWFAAVAGLAARQGGSRNPGSLP